MIAPLLDESLDPAKKLKLREELALQNDTSTRSLYRYEKAYLENGGFSGLKPWNREMRRSIILPENFDELIRESIQLKREVPTRSVAQIILILEMESWVGPGILRRSTLDLDTIHSRSQFNRLLSDYIRGYNTMLHTGINCTPLERYRCQSIRTPKSREWLDECFLNRIYRKVNRDSTVSIDRVYYDVPIQFIASKVEIRFLPDDMSSAFILQKEGGITPSA